MLIAPEFKLNHGILCHSDGSLGYVHAENEIPVFVLLVCKLFHEILLYISLLTLALLVCIIFINIIARHCRTQ